jgi:hypothetical protein
MKYPQRPFQFEHQNNDQWDFDWAFERQIIKLPLFGQNRTVVVTGGKQAIFDTLDAANGLYGSSVDLGLQNVVTSQFVVGGFGVTTEAAIRKALKKGDTGIRKIATTLGVGTGTVQRIKAEMAPPA